MNQLARRIARKIVDSNSEYGDQVEKIRVGLEILFMMVQGVLLMVIISLACGAWWSWIPFLLGFAPLRNFGGGFHAKTPIGCLICSELIFFMAIELSRFDISIGLLMLMFFLALL